MLIWRSFIYLQSKLFFSFDVLFNSNILAIVLDVCEFRNPVAQNDATRSLCEHYIRVAVAMSEDETIDRRVLGKIFAGKFHARLALLATERNIAIHLMLAHAVTRPSEAEAYSPAWVHEPREHTLQEGAVEYCAKNRKV